MKISNSKKELARIISENGGWRDGAKSAAQCKLDNAVSFYRDIPDMDGDFWGGEHLYGCDIGQDRLIANWHQTILSRVEYFHLYPAQDADGWIEWKGGECPVGEGDRIDVKFSDGDEFFDVDSGWDWGVDAGGCNIIAYRRSKPERVETVEYNDSGVVYTGPVQSNFVVAEKLTLDQLLQDWSNADDFAKRKQSEADEAAAMRDERWKAVQARAGEVGVTVGLCESVAADPEQVKPVKPVMTGKFRNAKI